MNGSKAPPICLGPRPRWQLLLSAFGQFSLRSAFSRTTACPACMPTRPRLSNNSPHCLPPPSPQLLHLVQLLSMQYSKICTKKKNRPVFLRVHTNTRTRADKSHIINQTLVPVKTPPNGGSCATLHYSRRQCVQNAS